LNTCPKRMINGPCGGYRDTVCEDERLTCVWIMAYYTAIKRGTVDRMFTLKLDSGFKINNYYPIPRRPRGAVEKILGGRVFMVYEYTPKPYSSPLNIPSELRGIASIYDGVDFVDNPGGYPIPSSLPYASIAKNSYRDMHVSIQLTARNRDRSQIASEILAASLSGIDAIVATTGDLDDSGKGVWDLDAPRIIYLARLILDLGLDHLGRRVGLGGEGMAIACSVNINARPLEPEILKLRVKRRAGAEIVITQPVFEPEILGRFRRMTKDLLGEEMPMILGIIPIMSRKIASFFQNKVGIKIPEKISKILSSERIDKEELLKTNIEVIENIAREVAHNAFYISAFGDHKLGYEIGRTIRRALS
jgi:5,10-methylenetetrahydrofolate reductase